ncbi:MAG: adenylate/guanylate cyclase domain-containing protein [Rhizobiaceae bacterium]
MSVKFKNYIAENFVISRDMGTLPERVQVALRQRERVNEIVVRIIQLVIVLMFSVLYFLAAKTGQAADFQPVPYVLLAYVVLSLIGLVWSVRAKIPDWAVYGSIIFDFSLLYSLMVSFHFQYEQPASFILKAPTLLYVFIFISLRALRLEWKFVAAAGAVGAFGWIAVVAYALNWDPENMDITHSFVQYMTSNSILIGAEVDKIISILSVTVILALVVNSSSNLLVTAVTEQTAASDFSRFFDKRIAQDIRSSDTILEAGNGERRMMAIINIDIRGFSVLAAEREPSQVMQMLSAYQGRVVPILQENGAIIDKFMGDGIMATFGMDQENRELCRMSLEAAEAILLDNQKWEDEEPSITETGPLRIGIGISHGPVSFGAVGKGDRLEMTVIGAPVNTAAKFEKHNKVLGTECIVSKDLWEAALSEGYKGNFTAEFLSTQIDGIEDLQEIAVLKI